MGNIPRSVSDFYDAQVVTAYRAPLVGTNLIARGTDLPPGTGTVSRDQVQEFTGKAKRGYRIRTIPRETGERIPKTVVVIEHAYGFDMHKKALEAYGRMGESALNGEDSRQAGRVVGESLDDVIFNGDPNSSVKGIYQDAGLDPYVVDDGKEWNGGSATPDTNIVEAINLLRKSKKYTGLPMKLCLDPWAYGMLDTRIPSTSLSYMDFIAKKFPNGKEDIYESTSLGTGNGLLCYYGKEVAERNVEQDIKTYAVNNAEPDKDGMINFNVDTYQATDIHHYDAFLPLQNLIDPEL